MNNPSLAVHLAMSIPCGLLRSETGGVSKGGKRKLFALVDRGVSNPIVDINII